jgi:hypothetical protein
MTPSFHAPCPVSKGIPGGLGRTPRKLKLWPDSIQLWTISNSGGDLLGCGVGRRGLYRFSPKFLISLVKYFSSGQQTQPDLAPALPVPQGCAAVVRAAFGLCIWAVYEQLSSAGCVRRMVFDDLQTSFTSLCEIPHFRSNSAFKL